MDGLPVSVVNELKPQTQGSGGSGSVTPVDSMNAMNGHVDGLKASGDGGGQNVGEIVAATTEQPNGNAVASPMVNVSSTDNHVGTSDPNGTGTPTLPQGEYSTALTPLSNIMGRTLTTIKCGLDSDRPGELANDNLGSGSLRTRWAFPVIPPRL